MAFLEDKTTIKNNSQVVFLLQDDVVIKGTELKKFSIVYGVAKMQKDVMDIRVAIIETPGGGKVGVKMVCYNENLVRGIPYNSVMAKNIDRLVDDAVDMATDELPDSRVTSIIKGIGNGMDKQPEVTLLAGYKVYFKHE